APLVRTARGQAATVNDVLLVATVDALHHVLVADGGAVDALTVSRPFPRRAATTATHLGNAVGVMPVSVPCHGPLLERLRHVAQTTRQRRPSGHRDPSTLWLGAGSPPSARVWRVSVGRV